MDREIGKKAMWARHSKDSSETEAWVQDSSPGGSLCILRVRAVYSSAVAGRDEVVSNLLHRNRDMWTSPFLSLSSINCSHHSEIFILALAGTLSKFFLAMLTEIQRLNCYTQYWENLHDDKLKKFNLDCLYFVLVWTNIWPENFKNSLSSFLLLAKLEFLLVKLYFQCDDFSDWWIVGRNVCVYVRECMSRIMSECLW